tara:strand:+ start:111 stop:707 length:597 start_codon:yes stop_codon:yes gene_type:complete
MIKIGLTGDIGSGKSFIAREFRFPVFNADKEVKIIYKKNRNCFKKLKKKFPKYIYSFPINKKEISKLILSNNNSLKIIERIVHPIVRIGMNKFLKNNKNKKFVILDIPLLIENKINNKKDVIIFIEAKKKDILKHLKKRTNYNEKIFKKLKKLQLPLELKKKKSNYVIKNDFKKINVKKSVKLIKNKLLKIINERNST